MLQIFDTVGPSLGYAKVGATVSRAARRRGRGAVAERLAGRLRRDLQVPPMLDTKGTGGSMFVLVISGL